MYETFHGTQIIVEPQKVVFLKEGERGFEFFNSETVCRIGIC